WIFKLSAACAATLVFLTNSSAATSATTAFNTRMYCSNYYSELAEPIELCDWCQSEERNSRHGSSSKKSSGGNGSGIIVNRSEYSGDKIKQHDRDESSG
ncbi:hypothetical protein Golob_019917, partial [Gossypium lobatum]|nr:hypothetical protein [Gossypium lobatum]